MSLLILGWVELLIRGLMLMMDGITGIYVMIIIVEKLGLVLVLLCIQNGIPGHNIMIDDTCGPVIICGE